MHTWELRNMPLYFIVFPSNCIIDSPYCCITLLIIHFESLCAIGLILQPLYENPIVGLANKMTSIFGKWCTTTMIYGEHDLIAYEEKSYNKLLTHE